MFDYSLGATERARTARAEAAGPTARTGRGFVIEKVVGVYPSLKDVRDGRDPSPAPRVWWKPAVTPNVVALGFTSFFTDISSEMVTSIVPLFLTFHLGFSQLQLGLFNGAYSALAAVAAIVGSAIADRHRRYKEVAGVGYAVSAVAKVGLIAARSSWIPATALLYADRAGKGLRTAPRDVLISDSALPGRRGEAFGVHRTLDTAGALAGPFLAYLILTAAPGSYGSIFTTSFWIAMIGLAILVLFVRNPRRRERPTGRARRYVPHSRCSDSCRSGAWSSPASRSNCSPSPTRSCTSRSNSAPT